MNEASGSEAAKTEPGEPVVVAVPIVVAAPVAAATHDEHKTADRLDAAKDAVVHGVESVVERVHDAVSGIGGRK